MDKSRGKKHYKDKDKYKKKPTKSFPNAVKRVNLDSNWDRYDESGDLSFVSDSTNFSLLANVPITQGSHFQFKGDKNDIELENISTDFFNLDLNLLHYSLATIPFNERVNINSNYFGIQQKTFMSSGDNIKEYERYLKLNKKQIVENKLSNQPENTSTSLSVGVNSTKIVEAKNTNEEVPSQEHIKENDVCDLLSNLDIEDNLSRGDTNTGAGDKTVGELEQWLDDILDN